MPAFVLTTDKILSDPSLAKMDINIADADNNQHDQSEQTDAQKIEMVSSKT